MQTKNKKIIFLSIAFILAFAACLYVPAIYAEQPPDEITHLTKLRKINRAQAKERIFWQNQGARLASKLKDKLAGKDFGGVWVDKNTDRIKVGVIGNSRKGLAGRQLVTQQVKAYGLEAAVDYVAVKHSVSELEQVKGLIGKQVKDIEADSLQVGINTSKNQVNLHLANPKNTDSKLARLTKTYGKLLEIKSSNRKIARLSCNDYYCDSPLRGGVAISGYAGGYEDGYDCTAGFNVVGKSKTRYVLTAGHCVPAGRGWATKTSSGITKKIGPIHKNFFEDNGIDAMIIEIKKQQYNWDIIGNIYMRAGTIVLNDYNPPSYNEEYDVKDTRNSQELVGARVCASGATSAGFEGASCGAIHEVDVDLTIDGLTTTDVVRAGLCLRPGDSGGPVIRTGKALGVITAGDTEQTCSDFKFYTDVNAVIERLNNNIRVF